MEAANSSGILPVPHPVLAPPMPAYDGANSDWHRKLENILKEGTDDDRRWIETALDWAFNCIRSRPQRKKGSGGL